MTIQLTTNIIQPNITRWRVIAFDLVRGQVTIRIGSGAGAAQRRPKHGRGCAARLVLDVGAAVKIVRPTTAALADDRQRVNILSGFYDALIELKNSTLALGKTLALGAFIIQTPLADLPRAQAMSTLVTGLVKNTTGTGVLSIALPGTDYEVPLTFSTGLTRVTNTITANLSTGIAGGQSAIGGTAASEALTLSSTSNGTKGKILFGTSGYDEVNNRLGIGTASPIYKVEISDTANGVSTMRLDNTTSGGFLYISKGATSIGGIGASGTWLATGATDVAFGAYTGKKMQFFVNGSGTSSLEISTGGQVYIPGTLRLDGAVALGGGAAATLGTVGGAGPANAAQQKWLPANSGGTAGFVPWFT
jgi:hypothetical protein